jgi:hypothetical protein
VLTLDLNPTGLFQSLSRLAHVAMTGLLRPRLLLLVFACSLFLLVLLARHYSTDILPKRRYSAVVNTLEWEPTYNKAFPGLSRELIFALGRQVASHEKAWPVQAAACPPAVHDVLVNPDLIRDNREFWESLTGQDILGIRVNLARHLNALNESDLVRGTGRGIVLTAGNKVRRAS